MDKEGNKTNEEQMRTRYDEIIKKLGGPAKVSKMIGISKHTLASWSQGTRRPSGAAAFLLVMLSLIDDIEKVIEKVKTELNQMD